MKLWTGRFQKEADPNDQRFNSSISFDARMYRAGYPGLHRPRHHAGRVRHHRRRRERADRRRACRASWRICSPARCTIDPDAEDIHTFVEAELTARIGEAGKTPAHRPQPQRPGGPGYPPVPARGDAQASRRSSRSSSTCCRRQGGAVRRHGHARLHPPAAGPAHHLCATI